MSRGRAFVFLFALLAAAGSYYFARSTIGQPRSVDPSSVEDARFGRKSQTWNWSFETIKSPGTIWLAMHITEYALAEDQAPSTIMRADAKVGERTQQIIGSLGEASHVRLQLIDMKSFDKDYAGDRRLRALGAIGDEGPTGKSAGFGSIALDGDQVMQVITHDVKAEGSLRAFARIVTTDKNRVYVHRLILVNE